MKKRGRTSPSCTIGSPPCCAVARLALTRMTIQENTREYIAFAMPSRTAPATSDRLGELIQSDPALMRRVVSALVSADASQPSSAATSLMVAVSEMAASSPASPKEIEPSLRTTARSVQTHWTSCSSKPIERIASWVPCAEAGRGVRRRGAWWGCLVGRGWERVGEGGERWGGPMETGVERWRGERGREREGGCGEGVVEGGCGEGVRAWEEGEKAARETGDEG